MEIKNEMKYIRKSRVDSQGANSEVWIVDEPQLGGELIVKEMAMSRFAGNPADYFKEAQAMFASNAPNVVPLYWAAKTPPNHSPKLVCICMPYFKKGSLAKRIESVPLPPRELVRVGQAILLGLGSIHARSLIHFDLKPSNVLFNDRDEPLVADFGQTCLANTTGVAMAPGMYPDAIPPEVYHHFAGSFQSDIYQAGLTLYRAANGEPLYRSQVPSDQSECEHQTLRGKFPNRDLFMPHVPKSIRTVIRKSLRVNPKDRYGSAAEMAEALGRVAVVHNWHVTVSPTGEMTWRSSRHDKPDLIVIQRPSGALWDVQIYTQRGGDKPRAKDTANWQSKQGRAESDAFLKSLFAQLESA